MIVETELLLGRLFITPSEEPLLQAELSDHDSGEEEVSVYSSEGHGAGDEDAGHDSPWTLISERVVTPPLPEAESESNRDVDPSGARPITSEVNIQIEDQHPAQNEVEQRVRNEEEQPVQTEEQRSTRTDPGCSTPAAGRRVLPKEGSNRVFEGSFDPMPTEGYHLDHSERLPGQNDPPREVC